MAIQRKPRLRKVYLLPNLFTAFNLFLGLFALMTFFSGDLEKGCWLIFFATMMDGLDGAVARLTRTQSDFGLQFDSLADLVSFGVAPALAAYKLMDAWQLEHEYMMVGVSALFAICGALRLARYNIQAHGEERRFFLGLPIPAAAATLLMTILMIKKYAGVIIPNETNDFTPTLISAMFPFIVLGLSILMVTEVRYPSLSIRLRRRMSFDTLVSLIFLGILVLALGSDERVIFIFAMAYLYVLVGLIVYIARHIFPRRIEPAPGRNDKTSEVS